MYQGSRLWAQDHVSSDSAHSEVLMANKKKPTPKKKSSREASQESKSDSEKGLSMFKELYDPNTPEF